jgi:hypothetical protein
MSTMDSAKIGDRVTITRGNYAGKTGKVVVVPVASILMGAPDLYVVVVEGSRASYRRQDFTVE